MDVVSLKKGMKVTPMMEQYFAAKTEHPDAIVFFRMGDFYEMFFEDAETVSRELDLTLTARNKDKAVPIPMAGVPHHASEGHITRLVEMGYTVAVCDQLEDATKTKGLVRRGVTRVVTPGVVMNTDTLDARANNFLAAMCLSKDRREHGVALALVDASTGEFKATELRDINEAVSELARMQPREVLVPESDKAVFEKAMENQLRGTFVRSVPERSFDQAAVLEILGQAEQNPSELMQEAYFADMATIKGFFVSAERFNFRVGKAVSQAVAAIVAYLVYTQRGVVNHIRQLECYRSEDYLMLDDATRANLELTETLMGGRRQGSLISVLDMTVTAMGARCLRSWLTYPLVDVQRIERRHQGVGELKDDLMLRQDVRDLLQKAYDVERLVAKVSSGNCNARDLLNLRKTLEIVPDVRQRMTNTKADLLRIIGERLDPCGELCALLERAVVDDPPTTIREGGLFKEGYHDELDELITLSRDGKDWLLRYESRLRQETDISSLKVKYNKVFGYFIDVTKANLHLVPDHFVRKQTLANSERYFTDELKEYEEKVLTADDRRVVLETSLFEALRAEVAGFVGRLKYTAYLLSSLDVLAGLAEVASRFNYCAPEMHTGAGLEITEGRHPVVERNLGDQRFVPNTTVLDDQERQLLIITGPNMAGKSTVIRQVALIALLAQMGSFVPAAKARIGVVDKIFSRVGASDNLAKGQSTFMVEMTETAHILNNATPRSLIILDEIGRGTSTYDGLSIAWAVAEHLHDEINAKTLFATHYHELTILAETLPGVQNHSIAVKEWQDDIIFLRKLVTGPANRSYGIQVGRLAGLPDPVVARAKEILANLEQTSHDATGVPILARHADGTTRQADSGPQLSLLSGGVNPRALPPAAPAKAPSAASASMMGRNPMPTLSPGQRAVLEELATLSIDTTTPLEALNAIFAWKKKLTD